MKIARWWKSLPHLTLLPRLLGAGTPFVTSEVSAFMFGNRLPLVSGVNGKFSAMHASYEVGTPHLLGSHDCSWVSKTGSGALYTQSSNHAAGPQHPHS